MLPLFKRELIRLWRQKSRLMSAIVTPLFIWFFLASGLGKAFVHEDGLSYFQFFFPGAVLMCVVFSSIFAMISVIEDRQEGFLQSVMIAPVSSANIALSKILSCALIICAQVLLLLVFYWFFEGKVQVNVLLFVLALLLCSIMMSSVSFCLAWLSPSVQAFHVAMNVILMPMWLFSGALFEIKSSGTWIKVLSFINPLKYNLMTFKDSLSSMQLSMFNHSFLISSIVMLFFLLLSIALVSRKR